MKNYAQKGFGILELFVSMGLFSLLVVAMFSGYANLVHRAYDEGIISRTNEQVRLALDLIGYDVRMAGAGMPLGQGGFAPGGVGLGNAPLPVLTTASASGIQIRLNETGRVTVLTAAFTPTSANRSFNVYSAANLAVNDVIYISNATAGGSLGLKGTISAISGNSVTIAAGYTTSSGASFETGSVVHKVSDINYTSPVSGAGITRSNGTSTITVVPSSTFTLAYYDSTGATLTPPLTESQIQSDLCAVGITVSVTSASALRSGDLYTSTGTDRIALRNLILSR